jgi:hypothetical protein
MIKSVILTRGIRAILKPIHNDIIQKAIKRGAKLEATPVSLYFYLPNLVTLNIKLINPTGDEYSIIASGSGTYELGKKLDRAAPSSRENGISVFIRASIKKFLRPL